MPIETTAETHRTAGVMPAAPWRVSAFGVLPGHRLAVSFVDGTHGFADLSALVAKSDAGIYAALADPLLFAQAKLELGVISWPNGADLDPDWLHEDIAAHGEWRG